MANFPWENVQSEARKRDLRTAWRCLSKTLACVTIRGKLLPRTAQCGVQESPVELVTQKTDDWLKRRRSEKPEPEVLPLSVLNTRVRHVGKTAEPGSVSSATSVLIAHSVLRSKVVVIFDYEGRTSSSFDRLHKYPYWPSIVSISLACTVFSILSLTYENLRRSRYSTHTLLGDNPSYVGYYLPLISLSNFKWLAQR